MLNSYVAYIARLHMHRYNFACPFSVPVRHKEQKLKQKEINDEREKRLEQSTKAYEKWKKNSKNKSKPATQGLLRMFFKIITR